MAQSEGSLAIEAAKQRLAAAKTQKSAASLMVQSVATALQNAKKNEDLADNEVVKADAFLKEMEKRWEVIEIDDNDEIRSPSGSNKRQKVTDGDAAGSRASVQTRTERANITANITPTSSTSSTRNDHFKEVVVSGCKRASGANGTYTLYDASASLPSYMRDVDNAPVYRKPGICMLTGLPTDIIITCRPFYVGDSDPTCFYWIITFKKRTPDQRFETLYTSGSTTCVESAPPKDGWEYKYFSAEPSMKISYK